MNLESKNYVLTIIKNIFYQKNRAKHGDSKDQIPNIPRMLKELAPLYLLRQASPDEWKKV